MDLSSHPVDAPSSIDQRVFLHGISWSEYEALLAARGESSAVRISYCEGTLEIMSPSTDHGIVKTMVARLLEAYAEEMDLDLNGIGSLTIKKKGRKRGVEPDECYTLGPVKPVPDLAIEVIWTHGGLDKLDLYLRLGVAEVWLWQNGRIHIHVIRGGRYARAARSRLLPRLDLALLARFVGWDSQTAAVLAFRKELRRT